MQPKAAAAEAMQQPDEPAMGDVAPGAVERGFAANMDSADFGCRQSQMMLAFTKSTVPGALVEIEEARLMFEGHELGTLAPRRARIWTEGDHYVRWDRHLSDTKNIKASWDLADPDWGAVQATLTQIDRAKTLAEEAKANTGNADAVPERALTAEAKRRATSPGSPWGRMYALEADIVIDGVTQTIRSGEFVREQVHMVVT
jgi:hypothetical protein